MDELYEELLHRQNKKKEKLNKEMGKDGGDNKERPTDKQWQAHQLVRIKGLAVNEVARTEGVSPQAIRYRLLLYDNKAMPLEKSPKQASKLVQEPI